MNIVELDRDLIGKRGSRKEISTPALILDLDALEHNILTMANIARKHNIQLRPHCKSHKSVHIATLQKESGAIGISCATLGEAEEMVKGKISGVLITSPITVPRKIQRLIELNASADNLMVVVDEINNLKALARANAKKEKPLQVLIDFEIGQKRTGARTIEEAVELVQETQNLSGLSYLGIQAYAGHLQHVKDYETRKSLMREQGKRIEELCAKLNTISLPPKIITGGGTGTFDIDCKEKVYTELQVGSYLFLDVEYQEVCLQKDTACPFTPSLYVMTSIISAHDKTYIVDAGLKAFATDGPLPQVTQGAPPSTLYAFMGDEHGSLCLKEDFDLRIGDTIEFLTPHCDPTINLYDVFYCVRQNTIEDIWPIDARGKH